MEIREDLVRLLSLLARISREALFKLLSSVLAVNMSLGLLVLLDHTDLLFADGTGSHHNWSLSNKNLFETF